MSLKNFTVITIKAISAVLVAGVMLFGVSTGVSAQTDCTTLETQDERDDCFQEARVECDLDGSTFLGLPAWYKYLQGERDSTGRCSPILSGSDGQERVNSALPIGLAVLEGMIRLAGLVAVVMVFYGGFKFITSQGSPDAATAARKTVINAIIGLVIVVFATSLVSFVGGRFV